MIQSTVIGTDKSWSLFVHLCTMHHFCVPRKLQGAIARTVNGSRRKQEVAISEQEVLDLVRKHGVVTADYVKRATGLHLCIARRRLTSLRDQGLIQSTRSGTGDTYKWSLVKGGKGNVSQ